ncbi:hypothetical protein AMJ86_09010 [bacterium SM23_57]|nr:MAG: hypothetical protein AMJ86_09010 [bacterium SM23_57]
MNSKRALLVSILCAASWGVGLAHPAAHNLFPTNPFFLPEYCSGYFNDGSASDGCTTALVSGRVTVDGRPLLWKNRDVHGWDQEFVYDDTGLYTFIGMTYAGVTDQNWGGVNEVGFAIGNANAWNLPDHVPGDDDDGIIIKQALQTCVTVDDFEDIMDSTNSTGRTRPAIYEVMDAYGGLALFEAADWFYDRIDVSDSSEVPEGYAVRANFSYNGSSSSHVGQHRHDRAIALIDTVITYNELTEKYIMREVARDLVTPDIDPYPLPWMETQGSYDPGFIEIHDAICRDITTSLFVIQGILPGEDPLLSTMWVMAGEPTHTIATPLWVHAGRVPEVIDGDSTSALCDRVLEIRTTTYDTTLGEDVLDLWSFVDPRGGGLFEWLHPMEDGFLQVTTDSLSNWRNSLPSPASMAALQDTLANKTFRRLQAWAPPIAPTNLIAYAAQGGIHLRWDPVTEDIFGRPLNVLGYKIYSQQMPFEHRDIGEYVAATPNNFYNLGFNFPHQVQYYQVTAFTEDIDVIHTLRILNEYRPWNHVDSTSFGDSKDFH